MLSIGLAVCTGVNKRVDIQIEKDFWTNQTFWLRATTTFASVFRLLQGIFPYLRGENLWKNARLKAKHEILKRQLTWFRKEDDIYCSTRWILKSQTQNNPLLCIKI
jgi:hypothetical protein